jgi:hypothetical protein
VGDMTLPLPANVKRRHHDKGGRGVPRVDYVGRRIGRFVVLGPGPRRSCFTWRCRCVCGSERDIPSRYMAQYAKANSGCGCRE